MFYKWLKICFTPRKYFYGLHFTGGPHGVPSKSKLLSLLGDYSVDSGSSVAANHGNKNFNGAVFVRGGG